MSFHYASSYLSVRYPYVDLPAKQLGSFLRELGQDRDRIESGAQGYSIEKFHEKRHTFGTMGAVENTGKPAAEIFGDYKSRGEVATMVDALKNILDADRTYLQHPQTLEGWMFINFIALKCYYTIFSLLKKHEMNRKYTPQNLLLFLCELKKVKINNAWYDAEVTQKNIDLIHKIGIKPIT
ncbi:MAG: hypothetical protein LBF67_08440 [Prevotellaceae bacterium]|jgi:hypothetical protein|nr:hypothetical protein [Prevotellaceae bacterium]